MELAIAIGCLILLTAIIAFGVFNQGKSVGEAKADKDTLDDLKKAKNARDKLLNDPDAAKRVRDRFTR